MGMTSGKNTEIGKAKSAMLVLRQKKGKLIDEKRVIRSELDVLKAVGDKLVKDKKDAKKAAAAGPFTLSVDSFEQFGLIGLNPPTNLDMVEGSVKELREKKDWYKDQPRGSVPTAKDIRKQNEKSAAKLRKAVPSGGAGSSGSGTSGKFTSTGDDFVPLGKGSSSSSVDASSWGSGQKKPSMSSGTDVASEEDPPPAGAAAAAAAASKEE